MLLDETVFLGRDNVIRLTLLEDGSLYSDVYPDHPPTKFELNVGDVTINSDTSPMTFHWDTPSSMLELRLGDLDLTAVSGLITLVVYSDLWQDGVVWLHPKRTPDRMRLVVIDDTNED